ncbi:location of vulva defective 1-like [Daphnia pulicaria]|uniref:location of vulva defective 1-like n=1 Tax=Daphnia pulicaria TaxID=35523 RepID=UPI001EEB6500|nr:location of vulva defective 1-like [Daphnia pulicaria]XP_046653024.1 location of vulva defective 1-like [Daphnia pulicaria]
MKLSLIFFFIICLAVIAVKAQTKTTLKSTTTKRSVTSTKPKLTTLKSTVKATTVKATTVKATTVKATTVKATTVKATTVKATTVKATTLKTTTRKTNGTTMTTRKPVTTTAPAIKSYKVCRDTTSTVASGSIQPLDGLKPVATGPPKTCTFTITAPTNHYVQMSCSLANLTVTSIFFNTSSSSTFSSSLILDGTLDIYYNNIIVPNRVYTSYKNQMTVNYRVLNATDKFDCKWTTIKAPTTTRDFKWCQESETNATSGSIQAIRETLNGTTNKNVARLCPFFINLPPNGQIQMSCPFNFSSENVLLLTFRSTSDLYFFQAKFNKTATNRNQVDLLQRYKITDTPIVCNWTTTASTTATTDFNNCVHVQSTAKNGTISSIANTTDSNITCLFSVFASVGQRIQISCTNVSLSRLDSSLMLSEHGELTGVPYLNDVYTSISNRLDVISVLNKGDSFRCNWTVVTIPPTTNFKLCRDGEATIAPGTITSLSNTTVGAP